MGSSYTFQNFWLRESTQLYHDNFPSFLQLINLKILEIQQFCKIHLKKLNSRSNVRDQCFETTFLNLRSFHFLKRSIIFMKFSSVWFKVWEERTLLKVLKLKNQIVDGLSEMVSPISWMFICFLCASFSHSGQDALDNFVAKSSTNKWSFYHQFNPQEVNEDL